jgi:hypothetical protein
MAALCRSERAQRRDLKAVAMSVAGAVLPAPVTVAPTPTPAPASVEREPAPRPFAELLRQSRTSEAPKSDAAKAGATPERATVASAGGDEPTTDAAPAMPPMEEGAPRGDAARGRTRSGASTSKPVSRASVAAPGNGPAPERASAERSHDDERTAADASATSPIPMLAPLPDPARDADVALGLGAAHRAGLAKAGSVRDLAAPSDADPGSVRAADADIAGRGNVMAREHVAKREPGTAIDPREAARLAAGDAATTHAASFAELLADAEAADRAKAPPTSSSAEPPVSANALAATTPAPQGLSTMASVTSQAAATLATPIESPEFAAAFGVQVSVFVREGVQHAQLHLNPAETGPVSIAITLEGSRAHVEFGADLAATRQAIENGLPALASALRDAGFTLAGGGVAQHSRPGGGDGGDDPSRRGSAERRGSRDGDAAGIAAAVHPVTRRVTAGGIDLYA